MKRINLFFPLALVFVLNLNATVKQIRWGSSGDPLTGLIITWSNNGTADSIAWGYTTSYEQGSHAGTMRSGYTTSYKFFKYAFPTVTANSTIYYKIWDSNANSWTAQKTFLTAPDPSLNTYSFAALGDCRDYPATLTTVSNLVTARQPALCLFNGDLTQTGTSSTQYNTFFSAASNFLENTLVYHAEGNHDATSPSTFSNLFDLPITNGTNLYYATRYANTLFITINTCTPSNSAQLTWLQNTLAAAAADPTIEWKIVSCHHAFFTVGGHSGDMNSYRSTLWKAFDDYGVDIVFTGHDHNYQRTKPVNLNVSSSSPVTQYGSDPGQGRLQIVSGGAGAGLYSQGSSSDAWAINLFNSTYNYIFCDVQDCKIKITAYSSTNTIIDSLTLDKSASCSAVGISSPSVKFNPISVFPNPAGNSFTLKYSSDYIGQGTVKIFDTMGKEIESIAIEKDKVDFEKSFDMSKHSKGVYTVSVITGSQRDNTILLIAK